LRGVVVRVALVCLCGVLVAALLPESGGGLAARRCWAGAGGVVVRVALVCLCGVLVAALLPESGGGLLMRRRWAGAGGVELPGRG